MRTAEQVIANGEADEEISLSQRRSDRFRHPDNRASRRRSRDVLRAFQGAPTAAIAGLALALTGITYGIYKESSNDSVRNNPVAAKVEAQSAAHNTLNMINSSDQE